MTIQTFCKRFSAPVPEHIRLGRRHFFDPQGLAADAQRKGWEVASAGIFLGEGGTPFRATPALLGMIAPQVQKRVIVNEKAAWLFICGKDILMAGVRHTDEYREGEYAIVSDEFGNILGFGEIEAQYSPGKRRLSYVKNRLDVGEYLRRERG